MNIPQETAQPSEQNEAWNGIPGPGTFLPMRFSGEVNLWHRLFQNWCLTKWSHSAVSIICRGSPGYHNSSVTWWFSLWEQGNGSLERLFLAFHNQLTLAWDLQPSVPFLLLGQKPLNEGRIYLSSQFRGQSTRRTSTARGRDSGHIS